MNQIKKVVIIGAGLGGLAAAIRLQSQGIETTVLEKRPKAGGKLHERKLGTHSFDFGPNTITMPHVFKSVLSEAGLNPDRYFTMIKLTQHTQNQFSDGSTLMMSSDPDEMTENLRLIDEQSAQRYPAYLKEVQSLYRLADKHFFHRTFSSWRDYLNPPLGFAMMRARPFESLDRFHRKYFKDERIIRAFNRYATYIGSSPFHAPATFGLIGHLEMNDGVYYTLGGNRKIAEGFYQAAIDLGATVYTDTEAEKIETQNQTATHVVTSSGASYPADAVLLNGDLITQVPRLLKDLHDPSKKKLPEPSVSAFVTMAALNRRLDLHHHHVFFSDRSKEEFADIFERGKYGKDPTIYICTSSKTETDRSPDGDNLFILVNAPPLSEDGKSALEADKVEERLFNKLEEKGLPIRQNLIESQTVDPKTIAASFHAYRGALYGGASNKRKDTFLRPFNRSQEVGNLFFAGGSTHPGGGSPMVVISGLNAADQMINLAKKNL
ncbi:phytoene desaturase family protein [Salisediminibacterium halotolerans]|uniref:4,4'-diaponeurosporene oxygenase n=1 Tax=Salisediminibacterium halotolerans TaxID=517425 RepID=A0A1H9PAQ9_9BACI|nr:phytoene desaturase family protein [Salisediminibacterium haloalkalitolerans]SER45242.1 phytoene desaturase [Salisediminibacterium haloalkalitolerans]